MSSLNRRRASSLAFYTSTSIARERNSAEHTTAYSKAEQASWTCSFPVQKRDCVIDITAAGSGPIAALKKGSAIPFKTSAAPTSTSQDVNSADTQSRVTSNEASGIMASPTPVAEDQGRLLEDALGVVRRETHQMRRCLETPGKLMDALKCAYVCLAHST